MKQKITLYQLFILMTLLPYGSAILFFLVPETKQDIWIAMLFYSLAGIVLQLIYIALYYKYPKDTLVTYMPKIYGEFLGSIISIVYISYFTYIASRVLRDFQEIIFHSGLDFTPMIIIGLAFMIPITYGVAKGILPISNLAQLFFMMIILTPILVWLLSLLTPDYVKFYKLRPVLQNGLLDLIIKGWRLIPFPYGETIAFSMIYPFVLEHNKIRKAAIASIIFESITLSLNAILFITTIGIEDASNAISPFLTVARNIKISFIEGFDILFLGLLVLGGFFKVLIHTYIAVLGASQMLKLKDTKLLAIPFGIIILFLSRVIARNYFRHINIGLIFVVTYIHVPLQIIFPAFTLLVYYIKRTFTKKQIKKI